MFTGLLVATVTPATRTSADDSFQLLRSNPDGYAKVVPLTQDHQPLEFPRDHYPHEDYRIEWWYLTANLQDTAGNQYGIHWTLFRQSMNAQPNPGGWQSNQVWMAHSAISTAKGHYFDERFARGGIGQAGVELSRKAFTSHTTTAEPAFEAWLDDWLWSGSGSSPLPGKLKFTVDDINVSLELSANTPWVLQGVDGFSQKSALGQASYYYSQPHIDIVGEVFIEGKAIEVHGQGWLDREWSSQPLAPDQPGWDWLAIHLEDGHALMIFRLRQSNGEYWYSGSWVNEEGTSESLGSNQLVFEPIKTSQVRTGNDRYRALPLHWRVELPEKKLAWEIAPVLADHWLDTAFPYWEGPIVVTGSTSGVGYLELTGY
jgi:predicted secreted hydrolase